MLLFIEVVAKLNLNVSGISIHLMLLFIFFTAEYLLDSSLFQYISCYCLSYEVFTDLLLYISFQYISCYCLSQSSHPTFLSFRISIHLMLLFILLFTRTYVSIQQNFNTSHVTVYLQR